MARRSMRTRKSAGDEPSDRRSAQKRKTAEEMPGTPKQKKKKSEKDPASERKGKGPGRPPRAKKDASPATPTPSKKADKKKVKPQKTNKRKDRFQMILEDDYDKDYIDYESPEEEVADPDEEDVLDVEPIPELEVPEDEVAVDITSDSDSDGDGCQSSRCPSEMDEMSMEPLEIWRDNTRHFPQLDLPESSLDLLIPPSATLLDALDIYESLRHFSQAIKMTQVRFEDFLAALVHREHSSLLSHTFLALLKTLHKADDRSGVVYGPADSRDGAYSLYCFTDLMTWPFALKIYAKSDPAHFGELELNRLTNIPYESAEEKIKVLKAMISAVVDSEIIRDFLAKGKMDHTGEETCRSCQQKGQLILCDTCPAGYHAHCANIVDVEKIEQISFECAVCVQNKIALVSDCASTFELEQPKYIRHSILGYDRHGRKFWYLVRRVWVEDKDCRCWYYSTPQQFEELINALDVADYEAPLVKRIEELKAEITTNMEKTLEATRQVTPDKAIRQVKPQSYFSLIDLASDGNLIQPTCKFAPGTPLNQEFDQLKNIETTFRLGLEGRHRNYTNYYFENKQTMNKRELKEIKDLDGKLYAMEYTGNWDKQKFCRPENIAKYMWSSAICNSGSIDNLLKQLIQVLTKVHEGINKWYFHPAWMSKRSDWRNSLSNCKDVISLARLLETFEVHLRPCFKRTVWFDCLGQGHLVRISTKDDIRGSEARKQKDKKFKIDEAKAEEDRNAYRMTLHNPYAHYIRNKVDSIRTRSSKLSAIKGEEYRLDRGFCGWYWRSVTYKSLPKKIKKINKGNNLMVDKLLEWRTHMEEVEKAARKMDDIFSSVLESAAADSELNNDQATVKTEKTERKMDDIFTSVLEYAAADSELNNDQATVKTEFKSEPELEQELTAQPIKLRKGVTKKVDPIMNLTVKKFTSREVKSIFRYSHGRKHMARTGGCQMSAKGFSYTSKSQRSQEVWPYPAPKPAFHIWWKYRMSEVDDVYTLGHLLSTFVKMLKWDLVIERPPFVEGDKLTWVDSSDDENITFELKDKRYVQGSARLRVEYELKQTIQPADSEEVIPTRDQRAVEAMARSGRRLRQLKASSDDYPRNEPSETISWIPEERMKLWQIELYHRVTEDNGVNVTKSAISYERGRNLRDPSTIRPRDVLDPSPDYTPEKSIPTRVKPQAENPYKDGGSSISNTILEPRNKYLPSRQMRIIRHPDGSNSVQNYPPYRGQQSPAPMTNQTQSPAATNVRITKQVLESILQNPTNFTQINYDKQPEHCQYLKLSEPSDLTRFPGGKNYQTKISNELKQIYSYTPRTREKYHEMVKCGMVLQMPNAKQPIPPRQVQPPQPQRIQVPVQSNGIQSSGQVQSVYNLLDHSTGRTIQAIKTPNGFQAIHTGQHFITQQQNSQSQNQNSQPSFTNNSTNFQQQQQQQQPITSSIQQQQETGNKVIINNGSDVPHSPKPDNGNSYITTEIKIGSAAKDSLEQQKNIVKSKIYSARGQMVQSFMPNRSQPIAANSPQPVQVPMPHQMTYQPVRTPLQPSATTLLQSVPPPSTQFSASTRVGQKFCVCKATFNQETQYGDIQCELCQQPFHATCVGASLTELFTCEPCQQKHNSARSTCICHSFDGQQRAQIAGRDQLNWCSCDVCQTWFHENCVHDQDSFVRIASSDEISYMCSKCSRSDLEILTQDISLSNQQLIEQIIYKLKNSKHIWPLKRNEVSSRIRRNLGTIEVRLKQKVYQTFKQFMEDVLMTINVFREHYAESSTSADPSVTLGKKEIKCCEIVEYDFSNSIREYIARKRTNKNPFVHDAMYHAKIKDKEIDIKAGMTGSINFQ